LAVARGRVGVTSPCRDCGVLATSPIGGDRCDACGSPRQVNHATLHTPVDRPRRLRRLLRHGQKTGASRSCRSPGDCQWRQAPGRARVARLYGVRSAMPMLKALAACPGAELIGPDMAKYSEIGRAVRAMPRPTPLVEPVSCLGSVNAHGPARARRGRANRQTQVLRRTRSRQNHPTGGHSGCSDPSVCPVALVRASLSSLEARPPSLAGRSP
jgi:hypothetical protein